MEKRNVTMTRRFYKTKSAINAPHILGLYSEAVAAATKDINDGDEEVYIVEVVAVVRRKVQPSIVIEVVCKS